jgi:hypothetical protein
MANMMAMLQTAGCRLLAEIGGVLFWQVLVYT